MNKVTSAAIDGDTLASLRHLLDRQAILDCITRCTRGIDRFDRDLVLSAYHSDAIDDHGLFTGSPEGFYDWLCGLQRDIHAATHSHHLSNHTCEIDGDVAHAETYYLAATHARGADTVRMACGRYIDRLERRDGEWKIAMRYCLVEWTGALPATENVLAKAPGVHLNGVPSRGPEDPSYRRPLANNRSSRAPANPGS